MGEKWLFRVAAKPENGAGHVSRSLVLAKSWHTDVEFVVDHDSPYTDQITRAGFACSDSEKANHGYQGIFVDSYDPELIARYRAMTDTLMIIEDHKDLYAHADIYLRPYPADFSPVEGYILSGLDYALIDSRFSHPVAALNGAVETITVTMGRYDSKNATQLILSSLNERTENFSVNVVLGGNAPHLDTVKAFLTDQFSKSYNLYVDHDAMDDLFRVSDIVFSAGGVTALEAVAMHVPVATLNIVDNQIPLSRSLAAKGAVDYIGVIDDIDQAKIQNHIERLMPLSYRNAIHQAAQKTIDTKGAVRISKAVKMWYGNRQA